jgi:outer membrane immunogenic protein
MISGLFCLLAAGVVQPAHADSVEGWNGCYVGANGGYGRALISGIDTVANNAIGSANADGGVIGAQLGCDHQTDNWVFGAQLSADKAYLTGRHLYVNGTGPSNRVTYDINSVFSVTGRIGYLFEPEMLAYFKAGGARTKTNHNDTDPAPTVGVPYTGNTSVVRNGWIVGAGLERKIGKNWSGFVEYNYMSFGRKTVTIAYTDGVIANYSFKQDMSYLGLGVNYRF